MVSSVAPNIFISYRHGDSLKDARAVGEHLRARFGHENVFLDRASLQGGEDFVEQIDRRLASCTALLVVIGPRWLNVTTAGGRRKLDDPKDLVRLEIATALKRDVVVIPLLVDGATMPNAHDLPKPLVKLPRLHALTIRDEAWDADIRLVVRRLDGLRPQPAPAKSQARATRDAGSWLPRPAPDAAFLRVTRTLRAHWLDGDVEMAHNILAELRRTSNRVIGPFAIGSPNAPRVSPEPVHGREGIAVHDLRREADGAIPVLLAPGLLAHPRGETVREKGWIRGASVVRDGSTRFVLGSLLERAASSDALGELYILLDAAPSPSDHLHIGLAATTTLRQGPSSTFARTIRELTPYLMKHRPHLYAVEGAYRTIMTCGLLRDYPPGHLHCLPPGRLGALVDMGAGVDGEPVAGLHDALDGNEEAIGRHLGLGWTLDCVVYLLDPLAPTSTMAETLALERQCAYTDKPFLDTYATIVEWFGMLDSNARSGANARHEVDEALAAKVPGSGFDYKVLALVAHDEKKQEMEEFVLKYFPFLSRFVKRIGTGGTAERLNEALRRHADELGQRARVTDPWIEVLGPGERGGNLQIAESIAMGLCDAALCFGDSRPGMNTHLFERTARIGNDRDRLSSRLTLLHDAGSAAMWALMWTEVDERLAPMTLMTAFAELFGVDLVLADPLDDHATDDDRWSAIATEAAWFLASSVAANRTRTDRPDEPKRVTIACGSAIEKVVGAISGHVSAELNERIRVERHRHDRAVADAVEEFPGLERRIKRIAERKQLTLRTTEDLSALWNVGPVVIAPMIGVFEGVEVQANDNAWALAQTFGGDSVKLWAPAVSDASSRCVVAAPLVRHWASTDVVLMTCADLAPELFGGAWRLPAAMHEDLTSRAVGEVAGLYLDAAGTEVRASGYVRHGMPFSEIRAVARSNDNRTAIMAVGTGDDRRPGPSRVTTALAALRAGIVSALVTDVRFATDLLRRHLEPAG